jgi:hypothetical protein
MGSRDQLDDSCKGSGQEKEHRHRDAELDSQTLLRQTE